MDITKKNPLVAGCHVYLGIPKYTKDTVRRGFKIPRLPYTAKHTGYTCNTDDYVIMRNITADDEPRLRQSNTPIHGEINNDNPDLLTQGTYDYQSIYNTSLYVDICCNKTSP